MHKLRMILDEIAAEGKARGFILTQSDIDTLKAIYNDLLLKKKASFIGSNCYHVLECCGLMIKQDGCGWIVFRKSK